MYVGMNETVCSNHTNLSQKIIENTTNGSFLNRQHENINTISNLDQSFILGNKCGHIHNSPRIYTYKSSKNKKRPPIIEKCLRNLKNTYSNPYICDFGKIAFHKGKKITNGRSRKVRSEARETLLLRVTRWIISHVNLNNKVVGFFIDKNNFHHYSLVKMRKDTGISESQCNRAIKRLKDYGYIKIETFTEKCQDGSFRPKFTVIKVHDCLFLDLGATLEEVNRDHINAIRRNNYVYNAPKKRFKASSYSKDTELPGHNRRRTESNPYPDLIDYGRNRNNVTTNRRNSEIPVKHILDILKKNL